LSWLPEQQQGRHLSWQSPNNINEEILRRFLDGRASGQESIAWKLITEFDLPNAALDYCISNSLFGKLLED
jgi:hypothetical protein